MNDDANAFYADPHCQDVFHNFLATIVGRTNTETGVVYRWATCSRKETQWRKHCEG